MELSNKQIMVYCLANIYRYCPPPYIVVWYVHCPLPCIVAWTRHGVYCLANIYRY